MNWKNIIRALSKVKNRGAQLRELEQVERPSFFTLRNVPSNRSLLLLLLT